MLVLLFCSPGALRRRLIPQPLIRKRRVSRLWIMPYALQTTTDLPSGLGSVRTFLTAERMPRAVGWEIAGDKLYMYPVPRTPHPMGHYGRLCMSQEAAKSGRSLDHLLFYGCCGIFALEWGPLRGTTACALHLPSRCGVGMACNKVTTRTFVKKKKKMEEKWGT
jgi:hypothetical protein